MSPARKSASEFDGTLAKSKPQHTILIVDDHLDSLFYVQQAIEIFGHSAVVLEDGKRAVAVAKRCTPAAILLDICLKGITGFEVVHQLKSDEETAHIPVIAATAMVEEPTRVKALAAGFDDFLAKPYTLNDLENVLKRHAQTKEGTLQTASEPTLSETLSERVEVTSISTSSKSVPARFLQKQVAESTGRL